MFTVQFVRLLGRRIDDDFDGALVTLGAVTIQPRPWLTELDEVGVASSIGIAAGQHQYGFQEICFAAGIRADDNIYSGAELKRIIIVGTEVLQAQIGYHTVYCSGRGLKLTFEGHDYVPVITVGGVA